MDCISGIGPAGAVSKPLSARSDSLRARIEPISVLPSAIAYGSSDSLIILSICSPAADKFYICQQLQQLDVFSEVGGREGRCLGGFHFGD